MHVVVSGGTGFLGAPLVRALLAGGDTVTVLTREPSRAGRMFEGRVATATAGNLPDRFDAVVGLAGENIGRRWSPAVLQRLRESRVGPTRLLREAAEQRGAQVLVSASGVDWYAPGADHELDEDAPPGNGFLARLCHDWEQAASSSRLRSVALRLGMVLGRGGALARMLPFFRWGLGGPLGNGRQFVSWIHLQDAVSLILWALRNAAVRGALNATAPAPVTSREFARTLGRVLRRPAFLPVPGFALRLLYGGFGKVLLESRRVVPRAATAQGFEFGFMRLEQALREILVG